MIDMGLYLGTDNRECERRKGPCILHVLSWALVAGEELEAGNHTFDQELRGKLLEPRGSECQLRSKPPGSESSSLPTICVILDSLTSQHLRSRE